MKISSLTPGNKLDSFLIKKKYVYKFCKNMDGKEADIHSFCNNDLDDVFKNRKSRI